MKDALCEFGQEQIDIMRFKAAEQYRKMRCLFSPESVRAAPGRAHAHTRTHTPPPPRPCR